MARLAINLLGAFGVQLDGQLVTGFKTNKARALLAYLAVEAQRPHQRIHLAGLFWPDWPEAQARTYLRQALANLQHLLGAGAASPFLLTTRQSIQFNPESDYWLDVAVLGDTLSTVPSLDLHRIGSDAVARLQEAMALYRGSFLEGFFVDGCAAFEEWQLLTRERLQRQVVEALGFLVRWHEHRGDVAPAQRYAWQRVELEPLLEAGHRQLMRLLAQGGEGNAALAHYEQYCRLLAEELGAEPAAEMVALVEQIRTGQHPGATTEGPSGAGAVSSEGVDDWPPLPPFLSARPMISRMSTVFVNREPELAQLEAHLKAALTGQGHVVFVVGDAGEGKTALMQEFAQRAQADQPGLLVAGGHCSSHRGLGDPFLPFREILAQLSGDFETRWTAGEISRDHARRLWAMFPHTVEAVLLHGPDLVDSLLPGAALAGRVAALPGGQAWREQLERLTGRTRPGSFDSTSTFGVTIPPQRALFDQFTKVVQAVAGQRPLLLWLDDLQWGDLDSIALLFHLGQRLAGYPILVVGAYRPEEVALERNGRRHPLEKVVHELQHWVGPILIDLSQAAGRRFVDAYLETEPNHLGRGFRETLYRLSGGHPLFTVELVRGMQERGDLVRNAQGCWIEGPTLDWDILPVRVEAVIAERVERLPAELREVLAVAGVQGERFTAEVIANVLACEAQQVVQRLSTELDRQHQLVVAQGLQRIGQRRLATYRFRHILFQKYLYDSLDAVERAQRHEEVARSLETLYRQEAEAVAAMAGQLAWHYRQAGIMDEAIPYLCQAGNQAIRLAALDEAMVSFGEGLALLDVLPDTAERVQLERDLLLGLGTVQAMTQGDASPEAERTFTRAHQLCRQLGDKPALFRVLWHLWEMYFERGEIRTAREVAQECLEIAEQTQDPGLLLGAHQALGPALYRLGQMVAAHQSLAEAVALLDAQQLYPPFYLHGLDPGVYCLTNESLVLWYLGYPDQARARSQEALLRAEAYGHPFMLAFALIFAAALYQRSHDPESTASFAEKAIRLSREHAFALWTAVGTLYHGWAVTARGNIEAGLAEAHQGSNTILATGMKHVRYLAVLADVLGMAGQLRQSIALLNDLLTTAHDTGEREWEAELYRLKGELLLKQAQAEVEAEVCFQQAIDVARQQQARSLELRATISLSRLWQRQGKVAAARRQLAEVYDWFTEGFDTPDLVEAQALLSLLRPPL